MEKDACEADEETIAPPDLSELEENQLDERKEEASRNREMVDGCDDS